jgi:hypothetical protein
MAFLTSHIAVARGLPGIDIAVHLMTESAEGGSLRETEERKGNDEKQDNANNEGYLHPLGVGLGNLLYRLKNIRPKGSDDLVQIFQCFL